MAKFIQLELGFAGVTTPAPAHQVSVVSGVVSDTCADYDEMAIRQGIDTKPSGPCKSCPLQDLCDADECGMKCFKLDSDRKDQGNWDYYFWRQRMRVRNWLESHTLTL